MWSIRIKRMLRKQPLFVALEIFNRKHQFQKALVIHRHRYTQFAPPRIVIRMFSQGNRNRFRKPDDLTILLVHNRDYKTVMEQSLVYLGIKNYNVVRPQSRGKWRHSAKIPAILNFVKNQCRTEYVLYCDSDDTILIGDPQRAIDLLHESGVDMIFSCQKYREYKHMPEIEAWFKRLAIDNGYKSSKIHLNAGVFIARREFLIEYFEAAANYVTENDLSGSEFESSHREDMPEFPKGCGNDQIILRFLYPRFRSRLKIDYPGELAWR